MQTIIHRIDSLLNTGFYADLIEYSDAALQPYKDSLTQDQLLRIHFYRIDAFIGLEKYDSIERELNEIKKLPELTRNPANEIRILIIEGSIESSRGKYLKCLEKNAKALRLFEQGDTTNEDQIRLAISAHQNIGTLFMNLKNYNRALIHYLECNKLIEKQLFDTTQIMQVYSNISICHKNLDSLSLAEFYQRKVIDMAEKSSNSFMKTVASYNLVNILRRKGNFEESQRLLDSILEMSQKMKVVYGVLLSWTTRGLVFNEQGKYNEALLCFSKAEELNAQIESSEVAVEIYQGKADAYSNTGDFRLAHLYQKQYIEAIDLAGKREQAQLIMEWESKIEQEYAEEKLREINRKFLIQRSNNQKLSLLGVILFMLIVGSFLLVKNTRERNKLLEKYMKEERENAQLQIEMKNREALSQGLYLQSLLELLESVKTTLKTTELTSTKSSEWKKLFRRLDKGIPYEVWNEFKLRFNQVETNFVEALLQVNPDLTPNEINVASLLRLNMSSKDISRLTNRSLGTINNTRSSIRKKLGLDDSENLSTYLLSL